VRTLTTLAVLIILAIGGLAAGVRWSDATWMPKLALDLEGGTQIILTPKTTDGSEITDQDISEAIRIIRQRVDASGVAEAEITSQGGQNIVVALPGTPDQSTLDLVRRSAQMNFRPVLAYDSALSGLVQDEPTTGTDGATEAPTDGATEAPTDGATDAPSGETTEQPAEGEGSTEGESRVRAESATPSAEATPTGAATPTGDATTEPEAPVADPNNPSDLAQVTDAVMKQFEELDCVDPANRAGGSSGAENEVLVTCASDGLFKYILGPVEIPGRMIDSASSGLRQLANGAVSNEWAVNMEFTKEGADRFRATTARLAQQYQASLLGQEVAPNLFAMVLDGLVISAPSVENEIPDGRAEVTGS